MSRRHPSLNALLLRKQLLVTEAEFQRNEMAHDVHIIRASVEELGHKARTIAGAASAVAMVVGGLTALRGAKRKLLPSPHRNGHTTRRSLMSRLLQGAHLATSVWRGWRTFSHRPR